ncbi:hypothetical protein LTR75_016313, partial [Friedmanniomyces endolithicus]
MAPAKPSKNTAQPGAPPADTAAPLADYFFISGIESSQVYEERTISAVALPAAPVEDTIDEDKALETSNGPRPTTPGSPAETAKRRSRYSFEARKSIGSIINAVDPPTTASNRS